MLHVSVVLTILMRDDASLTICKNFCRIHPVAVYHVILCILRPEDCQYDWNMQRVLTGLIKFVVVDDNAYVKF